VEDTLPIHDVLHNGSYVQLTMQGRKGGGRKRETNGGRGGEGGSERERGTHFASLSRTQCWSAYNNNNTHTLTEVHVSICLHCLPGQLAQCSYTTEVK